MGKKKTSIIWSISKEELEKIVKKNDSLSKILKYFNLYNKGGNAKTLRRRLNEDNIDFSHIRLGIDSNKGRKIPKEKKPLEQIMTKNSTYSRGHLKKRLIEENILEEKCSLCSLGTEWNSQKLVMVLDHINGVPDDHRKENLRLLCPNCNSQTKTFAGRNNKITRFCKKCRNPKKCKKSNVCMKCRAINRRKVKNRPSEEQLLKEIKELGYCGVGRKYGVSDKAIRKWL